jgi:hypothetical protein
LRGCSIFHPGPLRAAPDPCKYEYTDRRKGLGSHMPYSITIDAKRRRAVILGTGANDLASSVKAMNELAGRADFPPGFGILCDFRENGYTPGTVDSGKLADAFTARFAGRAMALVVSGLLNYGVANMITTIVRLRGNPVAAFREISEAEAWLDESIAKIA